MGEPDIVQLDEQPKLRVRDGTRQAGRSSVISLRRACLEEDRLLRVSRYNRHLSTTDMLETFYAMNIPGVQLAWSNFMRIYPREC